ncbi:tRNA1(Val) (adenine(37)-N6)-methyltransferase [Mucilaginibacter psychrotolerans]|uniref:tRNA1(Val) (adenine(37)-N6)-methyltransferase n=1 Tax=Mucilaginibacter psychrotolerans TaxID=1524096 RepID=A0A4Y8SM35_9SPHI|nr:methyltransferase [Mucilaginibacter psychrotolerans]TFF39534.1 methyltransferase domain-containing protein [Mucilaginibacter psychrotolerans]
MADIFKFKQFDVDQAGCAMKVNTDGVLLGALAAANEPKTILDIGTGTGVIALMLAQRYNDARVDAVEIDTVAAQTASANFKAAKFAHRLSLFASGFEAYFESYPVVLYDLIISNPPFFLNSLMSPGAKKNLARHTDDAFFERLIKCVATHLSPDGVCALILPLETADLVKLLLPENDLQVQSTLSIKSFSESVPHRKLLTIGRHRQIAVEDEYVIYDAPKVYSEEYQNALRGFLTIFV